MTDLERFKAIAHFEQPDYVPIFAMPGSPGVSLGSLTREASRRLVAGGMPEWVESLHSYGTDEWVDPGAAYADNWQEYWGTTGPLNVDFVPAELPPPLETQSRIEGEYEIIEDETGAITRQLVNNEVIYSMPEFIAFPVRDRESYHFYRDRTAYNDRWPQEKTEEQCRRFDDRDRPLAIHGGSTWGCLRSMMGPATACTVLYDDPHLVREIMEDVMWHFKEYSLPLIKRLRPEIVVSNEDCCYNHGLMFSPQHFDEFFAPFYRQRNELLKDCGADIILIDTDGNLMEYASLVWDCGITALCPCEVKAGNDLLALREQLPRLVLIGGLEKEIINEGNGHLIEQEVMSKVPALLAQGGYFPNLDHSIQPSVTFENLCKFMTLLHDLCGNPEGEFPRVY